MLPFTALNALVLALKRMPDRPIARPGDPPRTDADLARLAEGTMAGLAGLDLGGTRITDAGLAHLEKMPKLRALDLSGCEITDAGLEKLKVLRGLNTLDVSRTQVTDAGLMHLEGMAGLRYLTLDHNRRITDAGLARLAGLHLTMLSLLHTDVTDSGLDRLKGLREDAALFLTGTRVTADGVRSLRERMPRASISFFE